MVNETIAQVIFWFSITIIGCLAFGAVALIVWMLRYDTVVDINELIGDTKYKTKKRGRLITKEGITSLKLMGRKDPLPPPKPQDYGIISSIFGKKKHLEAYYDKTTDTFNFVKLTVNSPAEHHIVDYDMRTWFLSDVQRAEKKFASNKFWDKYGAVVVFGTAMILAVVIFVLAMQYATDLVSKDIAVAEGMTAQLKDFGNTILASKPQG